MISVTLLEIHNKGENIVDKVFLIAGDLGMKSMVSYNTNYFVVFLKIAHELCATADSSIFHSIISMLPLRLRSGNRKSTFMSG